SAAFSSWRIESTGAPSLPSDDGTMPPSCSIRTVSRCSGVISALPRWCARRCAACTASWDLMVNLSACIGVWSFDSNSYGWFEISAVEVLRPEHLAGRSPHDQLALVRAMDLLDASPHLLLERGGLVAHPLQLRLHRPHELLEREHALDAREVQPVVGGELLDPLQP